MPVSLLHGAAALAIAMSSLSAESDQAEIVETHSDFELVLSEVDVMTSEDPTAQIVGVTDQFRDGEQLLAELFLTEPMLRADLEALKESQEGGVTFRCGEVTLYLVNGWHAVAAETCELVEQEETPQ